MPKIGGKWVTFGPQICLLGFSGILPDISIKRQLKNTVFSKKGKKRILKIGKSDCLGC